MKKHILVILALLLVLSVTATAHSGRTDSQGGHHSSTGGYHYHHGYPAHQHPDGVCPYDYDDKTGESSGSPSSSSNVSKHEKKSIGQIIANIFEVIFVVILFMVSVGWALIALLYCALYEILEFFKKLFHRRR